MTTPIDLYTPFNHVLADNERFKIVDGQLVVENKSVREEMSGWSRFWSRSDYSQSKILKIMGNLYKTAKKEQAKDHTTHITNTFIKNYVTLSRRAKVQNEEWSPFCAITRFFEAKSEIDVTKANKHVKSFLIDQQTKNAETSRQLEIKKNIDAEINAPWWDTEALDIESVFDQYGFGDLCQKPEPILYKINKNLVIETDLNASLSNQLAEVLKAIGLSTVGDAKKLKIYGPLTFQKYLDDNKDELLTKLIQLPFVKLNVE